MLSTSGKHASRLQDNDRAFAIGENARSRLQSEASRGGSGEAKVVRRRTVGLGDVRPDELQGLTESALGSIFHATCASPSRSRTSTVSTSLGSSACSEARTDDSESEEYQAFHAQLVQAAIVEDGSSTTSPGLSLYVVMALTVFFGCACQAPYEVMHSSDRGCGHLVSLVEHVFGAVASGGAVWQCRRAPWSLHIALAVVSICYTLLVNIALSTELPTAVLITMKNGNLVASMLLGMCILGHRYNFQQRAAVLIITFGLIVTSLSGSQATAAHSESKGAYGSAAVGVICLLGALISRAATGLLQERACREYGVSASELLFYRSVLGLPALLFYWRSILWHAARWTTRADIAGTTNSTMWILLVANVTFDYANKHFVSFVISATLIGADTAGFDLWLGAASVLLGTVYYAKASEASSMSAKSKGA